MILARRSRTFLFLLELSFSIFPSLCASLWVLLLVMMALPLRFGFGSWERFRATNCLRSAVDRDCALAFGRHFGLPSLLERPPHGPAILPVEVILTHFSLNHLPRSSPLKAPLIDPCFFLYRRLYCCTTYPLAYALGHTANLRFAAATALACRALSRNLLTTLRQINVRSFLHLTECHLHRETSSFYLHAYRLASSRCTF